MKLRHVLLIVLVAMLFAGGVVYAAQARPVAPTAAPGYLVHGMPAGSTARLECDGWLDVVEDDTSVIEVVCQPWVLAPGR